jgi:dihydrofolate reductase
MRKLILFMHVSLDGYVTGPEGELDWVALDEKLFDQVALLTDRTDTAMYGRKTYELMESYWPGAGDKPGASKHDIEHSRWYNHVRKVVLSDTLKPKENTLIIGGDIAVGVNKLKGETGSDILIFGSPTASHSLMKFNLIDDYWLFVNPVLLGSGIQLFGNVPGKISLRLTETVHFDTGVIGLHYEKIE